MESGEPCVMILSVRSTHAFVACRQLGYNDYLTYNHLIQYVLLSTI